LRVVACDLARASAFLFARRLILIACLFAGLIGVGRVVRAAGLTAIALLRTSAR
jgi:hypothetical protein